MAVDNRRSLAGSVRSSYIRRVLPVLPVMLVTLLMGLLAWRVSADEGVSFGTEADTIYITDGFYSPEKSAEHGTYRWAQALAQLHLPNWGPGRIHILVEGVAGAAGRIAIKLGTTTLAEAETQQGQPWQLQGWGDASERTPAISLEAPPYKPPGEGRDLGPLVKRMAIYAPDARVRAWLDIALLGIDGILLYAFLLLRTGRVFFSSVAAASLPALYGPLAAFRDPWMEMVAWTAPPALLIAILLTRRHNRPPSTVHRPPSTAFATLAVVAALLLLYLGYMNAFDSDRMYQVAAGIAEYGRPTRYPGFETWTKYGFGQPLIAVPFYFLGKLFTLFGGDHEPVTRLTVSFTNLVITALTLLLLYKAARRFAGIGISLAIAATYLLATPALNYGRTFFSEPAGGLLLLAAILLILPSNGQGTAGGRYHIPWNRLLLSGLCLGAMILFKPAFAVYWPPVGLATLWLLVAERRSTKDEGKSETVHRPPSTVSSFVLRLSSFAAGPIVALGIQGWYNYLRYSPLPDALFRTGYEKEPGFSTPLLEGLGGLLFSPGKSIFLYAPVVLLAPFGLWLMSRQGSTGKLTALVISAEVVLGLVFNALWWAWTGNFAWGPRLIIPILPLLIWALAAFSEGRRTQDQRKSEAAHQPSSFVLRPLSVLWLVLGVLGVLVNIPGAMVDFQVYFRNYGLVLAGDPGEGITLYDPANSPLLVEPRYLLDGLTAAVYRPSLASVGMPPIWDVIVPAFLVVLAITCLWFATRDTRIQRSEISY